MKKSSFFPLLTLLVTFAVIAIIMVRSASAPSRNLGNAREEKDAQDLSLPFQVTLPTGWAMQKTSGTMNAVRYAGPPKGVFFWPDDDDGKQQPDELFGGPTVDMQWYAYNPQATIQEIFGIDMNANTDMFGVREAGERLFARRSAYYIQRDGTRTSEPYFRSENYYLRLDPETILEVSTLYPAEEIFRQYEPEVQKLLNSVKFL